jgi:protein Mpv17
MKSPHLLAMRRLLSLAIVLLLVAIQTSSADASTAIISKTSSMPFVRTKRRRFRYVVSSLTSNNKNFSNNTSSSSCCSEEEVGEVSVAAARKAAAAPSLKAVYEWYLEACIRRPFLAKGITSGTIAALGDVIAQKMEGSSATQTISFSLSRVATFFFCNLLFSGPFIHLWYTFLNVVGDWMTKHLDEVSKLKMTVTQVFLDQTLGTFVFFPLYIYVYDAFESVIRWHRLPSLSRATEKCRKHVWGIILTQYRVFPISNMINFGLVPYEMRVLFTSTVSLFWNIYLCSVVG